MANFKLIVFVAALYLTLCQSLIVEDSELGDEADPRCADEGVHYFEHVALCNYYIQCYEGVSYVMSCPEGLHFSEDVQACVAASESECVSREIYVE